MGSKRRIAKYILPIMEAARKPGQTWVEPFCGGCNTLKLVRGKRWGNDIHLELIAMYKALQKGWVPPDQINEDEYKRVMKTGSPELKGYAGFTHSFGGKYGSTYRRHTDKRIGEEIRGIKLKGSYLNVAYVGKVNKNLILSEIPLLKTVHFTNQNYFDLSFEKPVLLYCDPPYAGVSKYETKQFNSRNFWHWCRKMKLEGHTVFVSEYSAPDDFKIIWSGEIKTALNKHSASSFTVTEKLFTL